MPAEDLWSLCFGSVDQLLEIVRWRARIVRLFFMAAAKGGYCVSTNGLAHSTSNISGPRLRGDAPVELEQAYMCQIAKKLSALIRSSFVTDKCISTAPLTANDTPDGASGKKTRDY